MLSLARDGYSAGRQTGDEALEQAWQGLRLASHGQVARLAGLVVQVDERTADLEDRIADLEAMVARQHDLLVEQAALLRTVAEGVGEMAALSQRVPAAESDRAPSSGPRKKTSRD